MDSQAQTKLSLLEEYEDVVEELSEVRRHYNKMIEDYLFKTTKAELSKMKKISYKELKSTAPEIKFNLVDVSKYIKDYDNPIIPTEKDRVTTIEQEKEELEKIVQKIKCKIPLDDTKLVSLVRY